MSKDLIGETDGSVLGAILATTGAVAAAEELDGALQALLAGVRDLTGADAGAIRLPLEGPTGPTRVYRWWGGERWGWQQSENEPNSVTAEVIESGRSRYVPDNRELARQGGPGAGDAVVSLRVLSSLIVPLRAGARVIGTLHANSTRAGAFDERQLVPLQILADHAGAVVEHARQLDQTRRTRDELAAVLDAAEDAIVVYGADGRTLRTNRRARDRFLRRWGTLPRTIDEYRALIEATLPPGQSCPRLAAEDALEGRVGVREMDVFGPNGMRQRIHVHAAPVWGDDGALEGAVVISRDITELDRAIAERGRLDGAIKTVRLVAHELNNKLARVVGHADLLPPLDEPTTALVEEMVDGALEAAEVLARLQKIARFEEVEGGLGPMLDLRAVTTAAAS
jgi:PAS domain-containing protein